MKVTITIQDEDENNVSVRVEFDPPASEETEHTAASFVIAKLLPKLSEILSGGGDGAADEFADDAAKENANG